VRSQVLILCTTCRTVTPTLNCQTEFQDVVTSYLLFALYCCFNSDFNWNCCLNNIVFN
jgi:hypothetical protein